MRKSKQYIQHLLVYAFSISAILIIYSHLFPMKPQSSKYITEEYHSHDKAAYENISVFSDYQSPGLTADDRNESSRDHSVRNFYVQEGNKKLSAFNNWRNLSQAEINNLSILGRRLFLDENIGQEQNRNFTILFWKTGLVYANRYLYQYGPKKLDPFAKCSVKNCEVKYDDNLTDTADAILIHFHRTEGPQSFPNRTRQDQLWIWYTDESPYHTFMIANNKDMVNYNGYFNWSMSYRMDSDIPVAYGRTVQMTAEEAAQQVPVNYFDLKKKLVAVMGSNCGGMSRRWEYIRELAKYINLDAYGGCGTIQTCPGHFTKDCKDLNDYKFYLAFENSNCQEYITEKTWWNALAKGAVPVVMGPPAEDYRKTLPPNSFIHVNDFPSPSHLAKYLLSVATDEEKYMSYHSWRLKFKALNEHGFFATDLFHYCRICEALNYNNKSGKIYNNMETFWNSKTQCYPPTWPRD